MAFLVLLIILSIAYLLYHFFGKTKYHVYETHDGYYLVGLTNKLGIIYSYRDKDNKHSWANQQYVNKYCKFDNIEAAKLFKDKLNVKMKVKKVN